MQIGFGTYTNTVRRILIKNKVPLRHDRKNAGTIYVKDGKKLIEWAKSQKRLVTRAELAKVIGTKRLSPAYFVKYPELGKYIDTRKQKDTQEYTKKLYKLLEENHIPYKPSDRTKLNVVVDALLLGEYKGLAIHMNERPKSVSKRKFERRMEEKIMRAEKAGIMLIMPTKEQLNDTLIKVLNAYKRKG